MCCDFEPLSSLPLDQSAIVKVPLPYVKRRRIWLCHRPLPASRLVLRERRGLPVFPSRPAGASQGDMITKVEAIHNKSTTAHLAAVNSGTCRCWCCGRYAVFVSSGLCLIAHSMDRPPSPVFFTCFFRNCPPQPRAVLLPDLTSCRWHLLSVPESSHSSPSGL